MIRLNEDVLRVGDIVLTTSPAYVSRKIRKRTHSDVSHAMLYVTHCSVVHATGDGVHAENTQRMVFEDESSVHVLRAKGLPDETAVAICNFVREAVGTEYSIREAIKAVSSKWTTASRKQFCSRLIAQAYQKNGYNLVANASFCAPGAFLKSNLLEEVPNATLSVSDRELGFMGSVVDTPRLITQATNDLFKKVRRLDRSIQNFSDIGKFVIVNPSRDETVRDIIIASGYMRYLNSDPETYPWRYDIELMEEMSSDVRTYCVATMKSEPRDENRFTKTLAGLRLDHSFNPRSTFALLIDFYERLADQHALRIDTAALWLERHPI